MVALVLRLPDYPLLNPVFVDFAEGSRRGQGFLIVLIHRSMFQQALVEPAVG